MGASLLSIVCGLLAAFATVLVAGHLAGRVLPRLREELAGEGAFGGRLRGWLRGRLARLERLLAGRPYERSLRQKIRHGGDPARLVPVEVVALQLCLGLLLGLATVAAAGPAGAFVGLSAASLPWFWLGDQVRRRHVRIQRALPYTLDLLTLGVEAGLDLAAALARVVERSEPGPLADELSVLQRELRMGRTREEALRHLAERIGLPALSTLVSTLIQADRMGTGIGAVLRTQALQLRIDRTQRAEKLAAEAPVKMLAPLIGCIFPTVFLVLFGPIAFAIVTGGAGW